MTTQTPTRHQQDHARRKSDPVKWARKLEQNRESNKRNSEKRAAYDRKRDKIKERARQVIRERIYDGRLARGACMICGQPNADAHHEDYAKPLEIYWLCRLHHSAAHINPKTLIGIEAINV